MCIDGVHSFFPLLPVGIQVADTHMKIRYHQDHLTLRSGNTIQTSCSNLCIKPIICDQVKSQFTYRMLIIIKPKFLWEVALMVN